MSTHYIKHTIPGAGAGQWLIDDPDCCHNNSDPLMREYCPCQQVEIPDDVVTEYREALRRLRRAKRAVEDCVLAGRERAKTIRRG